MSLTSIVYLQSCQKEKDELIVNKNESEMVVNKIIGGTPNPSRVFGLSTIGTQHNEYLNYYISRTNLSSIIIPSMEIQEARTYLSSKGQDPSTLSVTQADVSELMYNISVENMSIASSFVFDPNSNMAQLREQEIVREYYVKLDQLIDDSDFIDQFFSGNINVYLSSILDIAEEIKNHPTMNDKYKSDLMCCYEVAYYSGSFWKESIHNTSNTWHYTMATKYYAMTGQDISYIGSMVGSKLPATAGVVKAVKTIVKADIKGAANGYTLFGRWWGAAVGAAVYSAAAGYTVLK